MLKLKNYILLSVIVLSQLHTFYRGSVERVDWFLLIEHTRRIDYAVMYLCKHLTYIILTYFLLFPKGIHKDTKVLLFIISTTDLTHYLLLSHIGFMKEKILISLFAFLIYKKISKRWV